MGGEPTRMGNEFGFATPANVFACADGLVYVGVLLDAHWHILVKLLDEPDLAEHESFATREARSLNRDVCNMMLGGWLETRTRTEAIAILREHGLPAAPVNSFPDAAQDEHVLARDMLQPTQLQSGQTVPITGPAAKFSRTPIKVRTPAPELGEHTKEVLDELGIEPELQDKLAAAGLLVNR